MGKILDLTGQRFGRLVVVERLANDPSSKKARWRCLCTCGATSDVISFNLRCGNTQSCGCLHRENMAEITRRINYRHGAASHSARLPEYRAWTAMRSRCRNPNDPNFKNYGGRGITICERWLESFENFFADMGKRPSDNHSIDRKDNDGNYEPGNCKWSTALEQNQNRRCSKPKAVAL